MNTTIVTMFFDLTTLPDKTERTRNIDFYIEKGRNTLELPYQMILFCDSSTRPIFEKIRGNLPTVYVEKNITDYEYFKELYPIVVENRKVNPTIDTRNTSSYFLLSFFKFVAIHLSEKNNYFPNTTHYAWIDLGGSHVMRGFPNDVYKMLDNPKPKFSCCYIHYRSKDELYPIKEKNGLAGKCGIAAGAFTIEKEYVVSVYDKLFQILKEHISLGVGHAEEQIIIYCYDKYPELFNLHFGDYYSIITNYHQTHEDLECVKAHFISNALRDGNYGVVELCVNSIK